MIALAFKNIKNSFKAYRSIYSLLLISQIVAIMILLLIYGIITSYNIKIEEKQALYRFMSVNFKTPVSAYEIKELLPDMLSEMEDRFDYCYVEFSTSEGELEVTAIMSYIDGAYCMPKTDFPIDRLAKGRYPTEIELNEGAMVAYGYANNFKELQPYFVGDKYSFGGNEYEIVGVLDKVGGIYRVSIPINSCTDEMKVRRMYLNFVKFPTISDYELFENTMEEYFGTNAVISDFEVVELDDIVRYYTVILLAVIIGGIAAFDTIMVYSYLLEKRKRQMAIFSIEGASRVQRVIICAIEVLIITVITTLSGIGLFELIVKDLLVKAYRTSLEMYTLKSYLYLIISYVGTIVVGTSVMINIATRKKVLELRR